ncbi:MAG: hypothetical protein U0872_08250 [Planctomycetaceae bacterium]
MRVANRFLSIVACAGVVGMFLGHSSAEAQLPQTRVYSIFPLGGEAGTSFDLTLTSGADLEEINQLLFNHPGLTATPKLQTVSGQQPPVANTFTVTIAPDVPVGRYQLNAVGFFGISNPRTFQVGARPEITETEPNNSVEQAQSVEWNQTINARMNAATDVDWFKINGKAGQRMLGQLYARRLDSRLDGTIELYDVRGRRLAVARNNVHHDPLLDVTFPADGVYLLKVFDFVYGGGEEYAYRFTLTDGPHLDFVFPPAGAPGTTGPFTIYGRNLPGGEPTDVKSYGHALQKLTVNIPVPTDPTQLDPHLPLEQFSAGIDGFSYVYTGPTGASNSVLIAFANGPVTLEQEPNNDPAKPQSIGIPGEIAGQFQSRGDIDYYTFEARAKETYWFEVIGHRLGYGADPYFTIDRVVVDDKGKETLQRVVAADDDPVNPLPVIFELPNDDATVKFTAPADGKYRIAMRDRSAASRGDPSLIYRLLIRKESPDFRVVAVPVSPTAPNVRQASPWSVGLRRGDHAAVPVAVLRRDGFTGPVQIVAEGLPPGVTCPDIILGPTPSSGDLIFSAAEDAPHWAGVIQIVGKAAIEDPALAEALTAVQATLKPAQDAFAQANAALAKPADDLQKSNDALAAAKKELADKPDDEALKKKVADAEAAVAPVMAAQKTAADARAAAEQNVKQVEAAVAAAKQAVFSSRKAVMHPARIGTILYNGQQNIPGDGRVSQNLPLSVIAEAAPFELLTDVHRVTINHGRQILVPVKIVRRDGFDNAVPLTFVGQPQNVQVENKPIPKEKSDEVFRIFVPPNAPAGTYVMHLVGQQQVSYRRNPAKAQRALEELRAASIIAEATKDAFRKASTAKDEAIRKTQEAQAALQKAAEAKAAADKAIVDAQAVEKAAEQALKDAGDNADAKAAAEKQLAEAKAVAVKAKESAESAEKARLEAEKGVKSAEEVKAKAEGEAQQAEEKDKAATAVKGAADERAKQADKYATAQNVNAFSPTLPIVLTIKPAPYVVTAAPAEGGNLKKGQKNEVKVTVNRQNGFAGPVTVSLPLPPGVTGVKAEPIVIPADKNEGVLVIETAADAPEAALANMVVHVAAQFEGDAAVDAPVTLKVVP